MEDLAGLSAAVCDMSAKFLAAEEWLGEVAERVQRLEAVLFRTPISNFLQIDKVIDEIVQKTHVVAHKEPERPVLQVCVATQFEDHSSVPKDAVDDLFATARDIGEELSAGECLEGDALRPGVHAEGPSKSQHSCALSIGCISTDIGETNTDISVGNSSSIEQLRQADITPRRAHSVKGTKTEQKHRMPEWRDARDRDNCDMEEGARGDVRADIFQEIDEWSTPSSMLDPTWTEPVPRGLEVVEEVSVPGHSSGSATPTNVELAGGCWASEVDDEDQLLDRQPSEVDGPLACNDRTPSPERQHGAVEDSIDDRGRMIAHLIAENARLQALVQNQLSVSSTCSSATGGAVVNTAEQLEAQAIAEHVRSKSRKLSKKERTRRQRRALVGAAPEAEPA